MSQKKLKRIRKEIKTETKDNFRKEKNIGLLETIRKNWKFILFLSIGVILLYLNSLNGAFVSDDYATIPNNPLIKQFSNGLSGSFVGLSNWLIAVFFDIKNPMAFHVFNLLTYVLICILVFVFIDISFNKEIAYTSSILFAILPIHVEAVSWVSGKPYLFNGITVLISLIFLILFFKTENKKYFWYFLFSLPITFFAEKVRSLSLIFLVLLCLLVFDNKIKNKVNFGKLFLISFLVIIVAFLVLWPQILFRIQSVNGGINFSESIFYNPFIQYPMAVPKYLQLLLIPTDLTLYHTLFIFPIWLNWSIVLIYLFGLIWFFIKDKKIFFALIFIFLALAPSMAPVKVSWLVAERYAFLGSLGFCLLLAIVLERIKDKNRMIFVVLISILISFYGMIVFLRNIDWQTNHNLWVKTVQVSPNSHNAWNNIGDDYDKLKQYENSIKGFTQSTVVKPDYADAFHNRANIFYKVGRLDLARNSYETALKFNPNLYQTYISLIQIDLMEKKYNLAIERANKLIKIQPNNLQSYYVLGVIYLQSGRKEEAIDLMKKILNIDPTFKPASDLLIQIK